MTATPDQPRVPARMVLASVAGLWLCYFLLATLRGAVVGLELDAEMIWRRLVVALGSMVVTAALWPLLRVLDRRSPALQVAAVLLASLPASLVLAAINQVVFADVESRMMTRLGEKEGISIRHDEAGNVLVDVGNMPPVPPVPGVEAPKAPSALTMDHESMAETRLRQLTDLALGRYFLLIAWAALYFALAAVEKARMAERREGEYREAARAAELRSLRYQINPHFLFNTLNSLSALVLTGRIAAAEQMIQTLSTFYRRSLANDPTLDHPLAEEIRLQQLYLEIEAARFPERLKVRIDVPDELAQVPVPGMILQPLVENAVKYGVAQTSRPVTLTIAARRRDGALVLLVTDDGPGTKSSGADGLGIGLSNVRDRLAARFGLAASLVTGPDIGGYRTELTLPLEQAA